MAASEPGRGVAHLRSKVGALIAKNSGFLRKPTCAAVTEGREMGVEEGQGMDGCVGGGVWGAGMGSSCRDRGCVEAKLQTGA